MPGTLIDPELLTRLEAEAIRTGRPVAETTDRAIESNRLAVEATREAVREAPRRADAGHLVEAADVHAWLQSWEGEDELPKPSGKRVGAAV